MCKSGEVVILNIVVGNLVTLDEYQQRLTLLKPAWDKIDELVNGLVQHSGYQKHRRLMNQLKELKSGKRRLAYSVTGTKPETKYPYDTYFKIHADYDRWQDEAEIQSGLVKLGKALAELHHVYHDLDNLYRSLRKQGHSVDNDHWQFVYHLTRDRLDL